MTLRWLILYRTSDGPAAKVVVDTKHQFPFGVREEMVAGDCERIIAIVDLPDDYEPQAIAIDDCEIAVQLPTEDE